MQTTTTFDQAVRMTFLAALAYWSFWLIYPLFGVLAWGLILAIALYPIYAWLTTHLGNHSTLTAILVTFASLAILAFSLVLLTNNMLDTIDYLTLKIHANEQIIPDPPILVKDWPLLGESVYHFWSLISSNLGETIREYSSYLLDAGKFLLGRTASISISFLLFIISLLFSGYLLANNQSIIKLSRQFAERIAPKRGVALVSILKETIQNVSRGVIGLSLLQSLLLGLILLLAGTPGASLISFMALILCIIQVGPTLLIIPVIIWLFFTKTTLLAVLFTIPLIGVGLLDNLLKPFILAHGLRTPMIVIFIGVIGGLLAHGIIGIFIGPVVLAIFYDLVNHWVLEN